VFELVQSDAGVDGEVFARFTQGFSSFIVPPGQTVSSGTFDNVLLTQGALASLPIIPLGRLDVSAATTVRVGQGGYQVPWLKIQQKDVPTTSLNPMFVCVGYPGGVLINVIEKAMYKDQLAPFESIIPGPDEVAPFSGTAFHELASKLAAISGTRPLMSQNLKGSCKASWQTISSR